MRVGPQSWALKNWCFWIVMLKKTLENPLHCKETQPVNPKENQSWIFVGRTDAEVETPILWLPDEKNLLIGKELDAGKYWKQEEKGQQRMRWLDGITDWIYMSLSKLWVWWWIGKPGMLQSMGSQGFGQDWATELPEWCRPKIIKASIH